MIWSRDGAKPPANMVIIAYEQALPGALAAGQVKEGAACNYVSKIGIFASKNSMQNAD